MPLLSFFVFIWLSCLTTSVLHDFHVSKTEIHYKSEIESLQLSVHVFIDDLELGLTPYSEHELNLLTEKEHPDSDSLISIYFNEVFSFSVDGQEISPLYLGKEISDDFQGAWCYLEQEHLASFDQMEIKNTLLCEIYDDQKNIVSFKVDNKRKAFNILEKEDSELTINLE